MAESNTPMHSEDQDDTPTDSLYSDFKVFVMISIFTVLGIFAVMYLLVL